MGCSCCLKKPLLLKDFRAFRDLLIMTVEPDSTIVFVNRTVPGITVEEAIGTSIYDYISPQYHQRVKECFERVIQTEEPDSYEIAGEGLLTTSW